jgi:uncharacterized membrane protein
MHSRIFAAVVLMIAMPGIALSSNYSFIPISFPGASQTEVNGLNDSGMLVGTYGNPGGPVHGFLRTTSGQYLTIDHPGAVGDSFALGLNNAGWIVGSYFDGSIRKGYLYDGISFNDLDLSIAWGINDVGHVVGSRLSPVQSYLFDGSNYTLIEYPGAYSTGVGGINNEGQIVGSYRLDGPHSHGFILSNEVYTPIDFPDGHNAALLGINNRGQAVGLYLTFSEPGRFSFIFQDGLFEPFVLSNDVEQTNATAINNRGQIAGWHYNGQTTIGFLATPCPRCPPLPPPLRGVPEPESMLLFLTGLLAISLQRWQVIRSRFGHSESGS